MVQLRQQSKMVRHGQFLIKTITSGFGPCWGRVHKGIGIALHGVYGQPIVAFTDGVVTSSEYNLLYCNGKEASWG